jgi:hypothetical protein
VFDFFDRHSKKDFDENAPDYLVQSQDTECNISVFSVGQSLDGRIQVIITSDSGRTVLTLGDSEADLLIRLLSAARNTES